MSNIENLFTRPEKPFFMLYEIASELSYAWLDNLDSVQELLDELEEYHKGKYEIVDCLEINSVREVELTETKDVITLV